MSLNLFFLLVLGLLLGMFSYFPLEYQTYEQEGEVPKIELSRFSLYEISHQGVEHVLEGEEGKKFDAYYVITSAKFSDNTKKMVQSIQSNHAEYRSPLLDVKGDVRYLREDGLEFRCDAGKYDTKAGEVNVEGAFAITRSAHRIEGDRLEYNLNEDTLSAHNVRGSYQLN